MVACMPVCSSFARHFSGRSDIFCYIRSPISSFKRSLSTNYSSSSNRIVIVQSGATTVATPGSSSNRWPQTGKDQYWQLDEASESGDGKSNLPYTIKQLESDIQPSTRSELNTFNKMRGFGAGEGEGKKTKRASIELRDF